MSLYREKAKAKSVVVSFFDRGERLAEDGKQFSRGVGNVCRWMDEVHTITGKNLLPYCVGCSGGWVCWR